MTTAQKLGAAVIGCEALASAQAIAREHHHGGWPWQFALALLGLGAVLLVLGGPSRG